MANKYYVLQNTDNRGVYYTSWADFQPKVKGVSGAIYKSFSTKEEADDFLNKNGYDNNTDEISDNDTFRKVSADGNTAEVYVDGSYNKVKNAYGYGVFIMKGDQTRILSGMGDCKEDGRNVEGEVAGARAAIEYIRNKTDIKDVVIYHDYEGIGTWANKSWRANKSYTAAYSAFVDEARRDGLSIRFVHVKGHTGDYGNECVDKLAKVACDIPLTKKDKEVLSSLRHIDGFPDIQFDDAGDSSERDIVSD